MRTRGRAVVATPPLGSGPQHEPKPMHLYPFSSENHANIVRAFNARLWAVKPWPKSPIEVGRKTRARRMPVGAVGILYSKQAHSFTVPFVVESPPDTTRQITDVWPGTWVLPFSIRPLGEPGLLVRVEEAKRRWSFLEGCKNLGQQMPLSGAASFASKSIPHEDWDVILGDLASKAANVAVDASA